MKAYVLITGIVFCLSLAHIWRAVEEGPQVATALWFILVAILCAALCVWASVESGAGREHDFLYSPF